MICQLAGVHTCVRLVGVSLLITFFFISPIQKRNHQTSEFLGFPWQKGKTGYPIVDAVMRQLWQIGWMHNRVRMTVASFLVKHLQLRWKYGAKWFWNT